MVIGDLRFDNNRLAISVSVTFASWRCDSASRLARFPNKLDSMPVYSGNAINIGWVRTESRADPGWIIQRCYAA